MLQLQRGVALWAVLIFLTIGSFLAITANSGSIMATKMAQHQQDRLISLQAAELALIEAEEIMQAWFIATASHCIEQPCLAAPVGAQVLLQQDAHWWQQQGVLAKRTLGLTKPAEPAYYVVEELQFAPDSAYYRISVRAVGTSLNSVVILQSIWQASEDAFAKRLSWRQLR